MNNLNIFFKSDGLISNSMKQNILKLKTNSLIYKLKNKNFSINFYSLNVTKKKKKKLNIVYKRIEQLYQEYNIKYLEFIIIDYNGPRYIANNMLSHYINGGFTYTSDNIIYIYRYREFPKVIIHEIFHQIYHPDKFNDNLNQIQNLNIKYGMNILISEAVTEMLATVKQLEFVSKEYNKDFKMILKEELNHAKKLSSYVLGIEKDNTNLKSYIVLKYILLLEYKKVLKNILNPSIIYKILEDYDINKIKIKKLKKRQKINFMIYSHL